MKKWENPKILNLNLINTEQMCSRISGWLLCEDCGYCFYDAQIDGSEKCICGSNNLTTTCNPS